jgi:hypothetical protein
MGSYKYHSRRVEDWPKTLRDPLGDDQWENIFREHPEFFVLADDKDGTRWASLRWRRAYDKTLDPKTGEELRKPLEADQVEALMKIAAELHSRAIAQEQQKRWWIPLFAAIASFVGGILGAALGAILKSK